MKNRRIGVAIQTQHLNLEDQQLYRGVRDYSREHPGFEIVLAPFAADDMKSAPRSRPPYDGILAQATPELIEVAKRLSVPVVDVWFDSPVMAPSGCVFPDFAKAGRMAGQHLASRGVEHFGYVVNRRIQSQAKMCEARILLNDDAQGYAAYVKARGFKCERFLAPRVVHADARSWHRWVTAIRTWLVKQPKPLGLFVPNGLLCRHIADVAHDLGLTVPHDLGLVCADDEPNVCLLANPSLTAVNLGYRRVGYEAAAMLDRLLERGFREHVRETLLIEPQALHPRNSTDATAVKDPLVATAMRFILEHTHEPILVRDVALNVTATRRTLERRFRDVLDRTVMQEITRCRLERLKRRLAESDTPIKMLVAGSGFNSGRVLYETFVREEGISPSAYRARRRPGARSLASSAKVAAREGAIE
jgi:LacI family transcriptional regulator